jgi:hypothetical protein
MHVPLPEPPLIAVAQVYPGVRFHEGERDNLLVALAQGYADEMAAINSQSRRGQGHFGWARRYERIRAELNMKAVEVSAQSDNRLADAPLDAVAENLFDSWRQSDGPPPKADHWGVVSKPHARYGDGLARSTRGVWFGCVIAADLI